MARLFAALLFVAAAISTSQADDNHQLQTFGTCGHSLTWDECIAFIARTVGSGVPGPEINSSNPTGCYRRGNDDSGFRFNNAAATGVNCSKDYQCVCDKLVGAFDASMVVCNSLGFRPTFTYNPGTQTQDVQVNITLGGSSNADCQSSQTGSNTNTNTLTNSSDFDVSNGNNYIPYGSVALPTCGGSLDHWKNTTSGKDMIRYMVSAEATVTRTFRKTIQRKRKFIFNIVCLMDRNVTDTTNSNFTVSEELITANEVDEAQSSFDFEATLKFYDQAYSKAETSALTPKNNEKVFVQIEKSANQDLFVYSVEKCYATPNNNPNSQTKDVFFKNQCPLDETMDFAVVSTNFRFDIQAFSFTTNVGAAIYLHCDLFVCLNDNNLKAQCSQKAQSACTNVIANNRRRRDVSYTVRQETVSSSQPILLEGSQYHAPQCGGDFVYDRVAKECSRSNLLEVQGIRLASDVFKPEFSNTSSKAFKDMAKEKEYLLWVLVKATGQDKTIRGVQVVGAREGSVVLDVVVKYADTVTPEQAFTTFKQLLKAPASTTRVQNVLKIKQTEDIIIEYVPVVRQQGDKADTEKLILIVVVVVLFVVVFIAGVTLFKVKQVRQQTSNARPATGFENKGIDA